MPGLFSSCVKIVSRSTYYTVTSMTRYHNFSYIRFYYHINNLKGTK